MFQITKIVFLVVIMIFHAKLTIADNRSVYAIGLDHESGLSPVIINLTKQTHFKSKIKLEASIYGTYFNRKKKEFILLKNDPMTSIKVYRVDFKSEKLSKPYFEKKFDESYLQYRQAIWSESMQTLYIVGLKKNNKQNKGVLMTLLNFKNNTVTHIDLSEYISIDKSIYAIQNKMLIIGYKTDSAAKSGQKPDNGIVIDLNSLVIVQSNFDINSMIVDGNIDNGHLAVSDNKYLYSYDLNKLTKLMIRQNNIIKIFGLLSENMNLYAQITQNLVIAERDILVSIPVNKPLKHIRLFNGKNPWTINDSFIANKADVGF